MFNDISIGPVLTRRKFLGICAYLTAFTANNVALAKDIDLSNYDPGLWVRVLDGRKMLIDEVASQVIQTDIVLLGELHEKIAHHRWHLSFLHKLANTKLVVGMEALRRKDQGVIDLWMGGGCSDVEFLERVNWAKNWGYPSELYMPVMKFCRDRGIRLVGLNCTKRLVRMFANGNWDNIPDLEREGMTKPKESSFEYRGYLYDKMPPDHLANTNNALDPLFDPLVRAQEIRDRAFAWNLSREVKPKTLVVGLIGSGHLEYSYGVRHQLSDLKYSNIATVLPVTANKAQRILNTKISDYLWSSLE